MNKKSQVDKHVVIAGLICITVIEIVALMKGINGVLLTVVVGLIAAAIGVAIPTDKILKR